MLGQGTIGLFFVGAKGYCLVWSGVLGWPSRKAYRKRGAASLLTMNDFHSNT